MLEKISKVGAKIGSQRHMIALRDSFAGIMPLIMAGSFAILINNVFIVPWSLLARFIGEDASWIIWSTENLKPFFDAVHDGSIAIMSLALVFSIGYNLASGYKVDSLSAGLISVGAFFVLGPLTRVSDVAGYVGNYFSAQGVFVALVTGILATEIFCAVVKKGIVIKMPELVPPAVGRAFAAIIPGTIALLVFALIAYIFKMVPFFAPHDVIIEGVAVTPPATFFTWMEQNVSQTLSAILNPKDGNFIVGALFASLISFVNSLFWTVGLHGANLLAPVMDGIYQTWQLENVANFAAGNEATYTWVRGSWDAYVFLGGSGTTIALLGAILFAGKKEDEREIAKLGMGPGFFQINEPVIFGLPIVLNPIYAIPFIISQPILTAIAYVVTALHIVPPIVNTVPWVTPPLLGALMATNFSFTSLLLAAFNLFIAFLIYLPFVKMANKLADKEAAETTEA